MTVPGRRILLAEQNPIEQTGIDFVAVNKTNHAEVFVYFVIDPTEVPVPLVAMDFGIECQGVETLDERFVETQGFQIHTDAQGRNRTVLAITFDSGASFEEQELTVSDLAGQRLDPFSRRTRFSFKQACPTVFDCACYGAPEPRDLIDFPVDYLARDFNTFNQAFSAFSALRYPDWQMDIMPDQALMLKEITSGLGDEFALIQDTYSLETQFEYLKERRSFEQLTRILGYKLRPELPASGYVIMRHYDDIEQPGGLASQDVEVTAGTLIYGFSDDDAVIPFEIGDGLEAINNGTTYLTNSLWTDNPAHIASETCTYIRKGTRTLSVIGTGLIHPGISAGSTLLVETRPEAQDEPLRRFLVTLDEDPVQETDELIGVETTRLHWRTEDALLFKLNLTHCFVSANLVPVVSGQTWCTRFSIGEVSPDYEPAIEREGPKPLDSNDRPTLYRQPLGKTVADGLSWTLSEQSTPWDLAYSAQVSLVEIDEDGTVLENWRVVSDMLTQIATDEAATIEAGHWGPIFSYVENGQRKVHRDYIGDPGFCLRFGDGEFGLLPARGSLFEVRYRTAWARVANLPANRLFLTANVTPDAEEARANCFNAPDMPEGILTCWNPFAFDNALLPENIELAKLTVPHFHKAKKLRAVRNTDFQDLITARDDIDATLATERWTGCWVSNFVATDPHNHIALSDELRAELQTFIEEIRLVGRPAYLTDTALRPLDLRIAICRDTRVPFRHIVEDILANLVSDQDNALFHPNNLSFGSKIYLADLETRIAAQPGVTEIKAIQYRWRGEQGFSDFAQSFLESAPDQIPVLKHDPVRPNLGSVEIFEREIPDGEAA